ncbi:MAG: aminopeptidase P family protein, partial [Bacteroides sp.]|nr:aminopeptidase P family protein [Bacteroides sp.]
SGTSMELYMANLLVGDNADNPTPYDFAMGGAGLDPSLPVGCNGTEIRPGESVMADVNGNYTGYMTDMTRTFALGELSSISMKAHQCSIDICRELSAMARPGTPAKALYVKAEEMAKEAGLHEYFMGHRQKAGFVGHGLGIEINEHPVIAPRSRDIIAEGNVFAIEPKFVVPGTGAVGIENTYCVGADKTECLTNAPEPIIYFD